MALFNKRDLRSIGLQVLQKSAYKTSEAVLLENVIEFSQTKVYDIFLSHSFRDAQVILGLKQEIESMGHTVYVDWVDDPQLDRTKVTKETANLLKERMKKCKCLFFAISVNSPTSIWMPWELGYFDGIKNNVAILPITDEPISTELYVGQEYLGLYYYVAKTFNKLWIQQDGLTFVNFERWVDGDLPSFHKV